MTPTHHLGLAGARVVQTAELLLSRRAIRDLLSARALGVMHGPAGSGKTCAAELAVTEFRVERAWVQFPSRPTMLHVARRLHRELTGADPGRANRFELSEELIGLLAGREWLLVVDEAQWLNRECIEYLRHLHDHPRTKFSLLLVGGDGCWRVLSREPMLRSRIYRRVRFARMRLHTVLEVIPGYHPIYQDAPGELLAPVDDR
jgi:DNA transposition AAA+ family ATPase